jgi:hypothetical protein
MKCPRLACRVVASYKAGDKPDVPSIFEPEEYCNGMRHEKCPLNRHADSCESVPII